MAGLIGVINTKEIALTAAALSSVVVLVAPLNARIKIKEWGVFFDGVTVTEAPVQIEVVKCTGGTYGNRPPVERTSSGLTLQTTGGSACSVEPTVTSIIAAREVHPQSGYQEKFSFGDEPTIQNGGKVAIQCTPPAVVNVRAEIVFEE